MIQLLYCLRRTLNRRYNYKFIHASLPLIKITRAIFSLGIRRERFHLMYVQSKRKVQFQPWGDPRMIILMKNDLVSKVREKTFKNAAI